MKLPLGLLQKFVDIPQNDAGELRRVLDDLGLEVKAVEELNGQSVFTLETLANRGDHLHVSGVAREISARYLSPLKLPALASEISDRRASIPVKNNTEKCLRYAVMEMNLPERMDVRPDISTYLESDSDKAKHAIVDILNFVQLELGQPMHAFDKDKVEGEIVVELSTAKESIIALDGKTYEVPSGSVLIRDRRKTIAIGGVIGCANSMVDTSTRRVLIESATFEPVSVRMTARAMGISTDASQLFEKGSDIETVMTGLKRVVTLTSSSGGGKDSGAAHVVGMTMLEGRPAARPQISLELAQLRKQMNLPRLDGVEVSARLKNLGFQVTAVEDGKKFTVGVPSWRVWDVETGEDLIEEFVRVHGYSKVKQELPALDYETPKTNQVEQLLERVEPALIGSGFSEVISKGFYSAADAQKITDLDSALGAKHLKVINSVESLYSHMKVTNMIHMARLAEANLRRGVLSIKVYELGRVFSAEKNAQGPYDFERDVLTMSACGRWNAHEWRKPESRDECAYLFKGAVEAVLEAAGCKFSVCESQEPLLHPGYQAGIKIGKNKVGFFGLMHPKLKDELGVGADLYYAELDVKALADSAQPAVYREASEFPAVRRDLTLKVALDQFASKISDFILNAKIQSLHAVDVLDNFKRDGEDFRRVTFRLTFQELQRTLESAQVDANIENVLSMLREKLAVELV